MQSSASFLRRSRLPLSTVPVIHSSSFRRSFLPRLVTAPAHPSYRPPPSLPRPSLHSPRQRVASPNGSETTSPSANGNSHCGLDTQQPGPVCIPPLAFVLRSHQESSPVHLFFALSAFPIFSSPLMTRLPIKSSHIPSPLTRN